MAKRRPTRPSEAPLFRFFHQIAAQPCPADADFVERLLHADTMRFIRSPFATGPAPSIVVIRAAHCRLLHRLSLGVRVTMDDTGAVQFTVGAGSRPFGNRDVLGDCAEALGWSQADLFGAGTYPLPLRQQRCMTLLNDLTDCLTVVMQRGTIEPGVFYHRPHRDGYHKAILPIPVLDALCTLAWGTAILTTEQTAAIRQYCREPEAVELLGLLFDPHEWNRMATMLSTS
ncbi:hypothetical protein [Herpetosiphon gulosus]|uniref:Uncharacterized protein n=1 Tax=Herpetosiphon gulosus TaxID=1973496 RepID=A0ABP9X8P6_9CHLR